MPSVKSYRHTHICMTCSRRGDIKTWEHDEKECYLPHPTERDCPACETRSRDAGSENILHFRHDHECPIGNHQWFCADKKCAIQEVYTRPCHKCQTEETAKKKSAPRTDTRTPSAANQKEVQCNQCGTRFTVTIDASYYAGRSECSCPECGSVMIF